MIKRELTRGEKIACTMKAKKLDNFKVWREKMRDEGRLPSYNTLKKNVELAELIGAVLGDGNLTKFPRTEMLRIVSNSNNPGFVARYSGLINKVFSKKPTIAKRPDSNAIMITLYEKFICSRLSLPAGNKKEKYYQMPTWISRNRTYLAAYLRGLFETDGYHSIHKPTSTYKFAFCNRNISLLNNVQKGLKMLGFHPHRTRITVQISRKEEVFAAIGTLKFRDYNKFGQLSRLMYERDKDFVHYKFSA